MQNKHIIGFLILTALPGVGATGSAGSSHNVDYYHATQAAVVGAVSAGDVEIYLSYPNQIARSGDTFNLGLAASTPSITGAGAASFSTIAFIGMAGCTAGTFTPIPAVGTFVGSHTPITTTAPTCTGTVTGNILAAGTIIQSFALSFTVATNQPQLSGTLDSQNRLCAASTHGAPCTAPNTTLQINGTLATDTPENLLSDPWLPIYLGMAILYIATRREKPNYLAVACAGAFIAYAAYYSPFASEPIRYAVALFGAYNILLGVLSLMDKNPNGDMEK